MSERLIDIRTELAASPRTRVEIATLRRDVTTAAAHPKTVKAAFAREMVARFHDQAAARRAEEEFERRFAAREVDPDSVPVTSVPLGASTSCADTRS